MLWHHLIKSVIVGPFSPYVLFFFLHRDGLSGCDDFVLLSLTFVRRVEVDP